MKLDILNIIAEDREMVKFSAILEDLFRGSELQEIDDDNIIDGIRVMKEIIAGHGDDLSFEEIELAVKTWHTLSVLLKDSIVGLKEQAEVNKLIDYD